MWRIVTDLILWLKLAFYFYLFTGLPLLTGCEIQGFFQDFSGPFQANSRTFRTKKALVILYINSAMSFTRPASGEKSSLRFSFYTLLHQWYYVRLWQTVHFDYYLQLKVKLFAHSRISKNRNPNSRTFQGLEFSFANSRTFQDFQGPWQSCFPIFIENPLFNSWSQDLLCSSTL